MALGHVFVSYCVKDARAVHDLVADLEAKDISAWIAPRDVRPGIDYSEQIQDAIEQCSAFVVVVTEAANASLFVRAETEMAFSSRRPIFPVRFSELAPAKGLSLFLNIHHWTNAFGSEMDRNLTRLAAELGAISCRRADVAAIAPRLSPEEPIAPRPDMSLSISGMDAHGRSSSATPVRTPVLTRRRTIIAAAVAGFTFVPLAWALGVSGSDSTPATSVSEINKAVWEAIGTETLLSRPIHIQRDSRTSGPPPRFREGVPRR